MNLLELAKLNQCPIVHASTSEVYGDPEQHPQSESYWGNVNPIGQRACYNEGKRCAESLCLDYHRQYGVDVKIARIFNTYGPAMNKQDGRVVSNFIYQALRHKPITIFGDGQQTRSFCYVDDTVEALCRLMNTPTYFHGPLNIGNPQEVTVLSLAKKIIELVESPSKISFLPLPEDDPVRRCPDIALANTMLDWQPNIDLETGLTKTISYVNAFLKK